MGRSSRRPRRTSPGLRTQGASTLDTVDAPMALRLTRHLARASQADYEQACEAADVANQSLVRGVLALRTLQASASARPTRCVRRSVDCRPSCPPLRRPGTSAASAHPASVTRCPRCSTASGPISFRGLKKLYATCHPKRRMAKEPARSSSSGTAHFGTTRDTGAGPVRRPRARRSARTRRGPPPAAPDPRPVDASDSEAANRRLDRLRALHRCTPRR